MSKFYRYLGFIALAWSLGVIYYCVVNTPGFNILEQVISDLGSVPNVSRIFNTSVIVSGILLLIFVNSLSKDCNWKLLTRILLSLSAIGLVLIGLFPVKYPLVIDLQRYYHWSGAALFFLGLPAGMISANLKKKTFTANIQILWGLLAIVLPVVVFFTTEYRGFAELLSIIMNSIWLLSISFVQIANRKVK